MDRGSEFLAYQQEELMVPWLFLFLNNLKPGWGVHFIMDKSTAIQCDLNRGSYHSPPLLETTNLILTVAVSKNQFIQASFVHSLQHVGRCPIDVKDCVIIHDSESSSIQVDHIIKGKPSVRSLYHHGQHPSHDMLLQFSFQGQTIIDITID